MAQEDRKNEDLQERLEKLLDWELSKQLTWAVVLLTTILGLVALFATNLASNWVFIIDFPKIGVNLEKTPFVIIFFSLLFFGVDMSFYRLVVSLERSRNIIERLPSTVQKQELIDKALWKGFYGIFVAKRKDNSYVVRKSLVFPILILVDIIFFWALLSI